ASEEVEEAVIVNEGTVAGTKPEIAPSGNCCFRTVPVSKHHHVRVARPVDELSLSVRRELVAVAVVDLDIESRAGPAGSATFATVEGVKCWTVGFGLAEH